MRELGEDQSPRRFFANPRVTPAAIVATHRRATEQRVARSPVILAGQDTPTVNFTRHRRTHGLGPSGQAGRAGFFLPACVAVSPAGVPLGLWGGRTWVRPPASKDNFLSPPGAGGYGSDGYAAPTRRLDPPSAPVDLRTAVRGIAQRGGCLGRRGDGDPGVKTLWRGYRRLDDLTVMGDILHPPG